MAWRIILPSVVYPVAICIAAYQIRLGLEKQGSEMKLGMKGLMSDARSGTDHLADGLEKLGQ